MAIGDIVSLVRWLSLGTVNRGCFLLVSRTGGRASKASFPGSTWEREGASGVLQYSPCAAEGARSVGFVSVAGPFRVRAPHTPSTEALFPVG